MWTVANSLPSRSIILACVLTLLWSCIAGAQEDRWYRVIPADSTEATTHDKRLENLLLYEAQKKDVGVAVLLGLLIPGGGNFYAGDVLGGAFLVSATIVGLVLAGSDDTADLGTAMVFAAIITSPISGGLEASSRNKKLKKELGIAFIPSVKTPALAFVYRF